MRYALYSMLLGAMMLGSTPALAHDSNHGNQNNYKRDYSSPSQGHYGYGPPSAYYRPAPPPMWKIPVQYKFQPQEDYLIIRWFRDHPTYYLQPVYISGRIDNHLRSLYGPVYQTYALPIDLDRRLAPVPYGFQRLFINHQILLIDMRSGNIHDVIYL